MDRHRARRDGRWSAATARSTGRLPRRALAQPAECAATYLRADQGVREQRLGDDGLVSSWMMPSMRDVVAAAVEAFAQRPGVDVLGDSAVVDADGRLLHFNWVPGAPRRRPQGAQLHRPARRVHAPSALQPTGSSTQLPVRDGPRALAAARRSCRFSGSTGSWRSTATTTRASRTPGSTCTSWDRELAQGLITTWRGRKVCLKALKVSFRLAGLSLAAGALPGQPHFRPLGGASPCSRPFSATASTSTAAAPCVVYWNNIPSPYFVRRMNALQKQGQRRRRGVVQRPAHARPQLVGRRADVEIPVPETCSRFVAGVRAVTSGLVNRPPSLMVGLDLERGVRARDRVGEDGRSAGR